MIDFAIAALPRSATAWLSAWFTNEKSICWHETLMTQDLKSLAAMSHGRMLGVAETALCQFSPDEINALPGKKLIVHRPLKAVNQSLAALGLPEMDAKAASNLDSIEGYHLTFDAVFSPSKFSAAHEWLVGYPFDEDRFHGLRRLNVQNQSAIKMCQELTGAAQ
jgi:hypothetical protein